MYKILQSNGGGAQMEVGEIYPHGLMLLLPFEPQSPICRMGLTPLFLSISFVPQRTESVWKVLADVTCYAVEGRNAKGGVRNGFLVELLNGD